jgi:hypothetical protein
MYGRIIREIREQRKKMGFDQQLQHQEWIKENEGHSTSTTGKNSNQKSQEYRSSTELADMDFEENCENNHKYSKLLYPV